MARGIISPAGLFGLGVLVVYMLSDRKVPPVSTPSTPAPWPPAVPRTSAQTRADIVHAAIREIGNRDAGKYWRDTLSQNSYDWPRHWCGAFALWALRQGGIAQDVRWRIGSGFLYRLPVTSEPQPGDVAYFDTHQHHAIVEKLEAAPNGRILVTIDGNSGPSPGEVRRVRRNVADVAAFYSIQPWILHA